MTFFHIYSDESRQDAHRYMLYGMIFVPRGTAENAFKADLAAYRQSKGLKAEMKWAKISRGMLPVYKGYVDIFFNHPLVEFKCLVVDTHKIDYQRFHEDDKETAFFNFYFYAISRNLALGNQYIIYADERDTRQQLRWFQLQAQINYHWLQNGATDAIVRGLQPVDSKLHDALQIGDLLLGAVGYDLDEFNTSEHRLEFVRHITERVGCEQLRDHWGRGTRFNIWKFRFPTDEEIARRQERDG